jgi:hypothetical protein
MRRGGKPPSPDNFINIEDDPIGPRKKEKE